MHDERKIRAGNDMTRKGKAFVKKLNMIYLMLIFLLLSGNIILLCKMQVQMKRIHSTLAAVLDELDLQQENWDSLEPDAQNDITGYYAAGPSTTGQDVSGSAAAGQDAAGTTVTGHVAAGSAVKGRDAAESTATGRDTTGSAATGQDATGSAATGRDITGSAATGQDAAGSTATGRDAAGSTVAGQGTTGSNGAGHGAMKHGTTGNGTSSDAVMLDDTPQPAEVDYVSLCGLSEVDVPVRRTRAESLVRLKELAMDNELISDIYKNNRSYSDNMLGALANNPEMADFVAGYLDAPAKATGAGLTEAEKEQKYPLFLQWDPRWGYAEYGDNSNIGLAGCGPVCLSMALYYLLGDESLTPDKIAEYSMKNGYYVSGTGTAWSLLTDVPAKYGVKVNQPGVSEQNIKMALDEGSIIICSMKPGDFTANGHFIVIYGYDEEGFQVNDPNCVARSREQWLFEDIGKQIKHIWVLGEKKLDIE